MSDDLPTGEPSRRVRVIRKVVFAVAVVLFLTLLSILGGTGYHVVSIRQLSFVTHSQLGYADATFYCDLVFNPLLYPTYWAKGFGHPSGEFSMLFIPESYRPGEFGGPIWGANPASRYGNYILYVVTSDFYFTLAYLSTLAIAAEITGKREIYVAFLMGIAGFVAADLVGVVVGLSFGIVLVLFLTRKSSKSDRLRRLWRSLWTSRSEY